LRRRSLRFEHVWAPLQYIPLPLPCLPGGIHCLPGLPASHAPGDDAWKAWRHVRKAGWGRWRRYPASACRLAAACCLRDWRRLLLKFSCTPCTWRCAVKSWQLAAQTRQGEVIRSLALAAMATWWSVFEERWHGVGMTVGGEGGEPVLCVTTTCPLLRYPPTNLQVPFSFMLPFARCCSALVPSVYSLFMLPCRRQRTFSRHYLLRTAPDFRVSVAVYRVSPSFAWWTCAYYRVAAAGGNRRSFLPSSPAVYGALPFRSALRPALRAYRHCSRIFGGRGLRCRYHRTTYARVRRRGTCLLAAYLLPPVLSGLALGCSPDMDDVHAVRVCRAYHPPALPHTFPSTTCPTCLYLNLSLPARGALRRSGRGRCDGTDGHLLRV